MLDEFRSFAGNVWAKILLLLLFLSFIVWGIGDMVRAPGSGGEIANVGGVSISRDEFGHSLSREREGLRQLMGDNYSSEALKQLNIPQHVLKKLINNKLLQLDAESLGLLPGDGDVVRNIRTNPAFQDNKGNFDKGIFEAMLRNTNRTEKMYVDSLRQDMVVNLLMDIISSGHPHMDAAADLLYQIREEQRTATLYALEPSLVTNLAKPDDAQLNGYYKAHQQQFNSPEYRTLSYVILTNDALPANNTITYEQLHAAYQERIDEFKRPERRVAEQMLFNSEDKAKKAYDQLKSGQPFDTVAKNSDIANKNALSLGTIERDKVADGTADAIFSLKSGEFSEPVKSPFGWHIFHVSRIIASSVAPLEEVRPLLEKDLKQRGGDDALYKLANKLEDALAGGSSLQEASKEMGLKVATLGPLDHQGMGQDGNPVKTMPAIDKFLDTAFKTEEKTESPLTAIKGGYYIVHVEQVTPERARPLAEVKDRVIASWNQEEREKRLGKLAEDIAGKLSNATTRNAAIAQYSLTPIATGKIRRNSRTVDTISLPPALVVDIFSHKPGNATKSYAQVNSKNPAKRDGYLVAVVDSIVPPPAPGKDTKLLRTVSDIRKGIEDSAQNELIEEYLRHLYDKYPVHINESLLQSF